MSQRAHLGKTSSPKPHRGKGRKLGQTASHVELREAVPQGDDVTGDLQRSKERVLLLFDEKVTADSVNADLFAQLQAKDSLIDQLNARLLSSTRKTDGESQGAKDKQLKALLDDKVQFAKALKAAEERAIDLETKLKVTEEKLAEEKEQQEVLNEALTEESEALKAQLRDRGEQLRGAKNDIVEMSKIVEDLTRLNGELNEKIKALNEEMERNNTENYQATKKAEQVEELERELVQSKTAQQQLEVKLKQANEDASVTKELRELIYRVGKETDGVIAKISVVEHDAARNAVGVLDRLVADMRARAQAPREHNPDRVAALKLKIKELQEAVEEERHKAAKALASEKAHQSRVESLLAEHTRMKASLEDHIDRLKHRLEPLQSIHEKASNQRHELELKVESLNAELQRKQTEAAFLTERQQATKSRLDELRKSEEENRKAARDLRLENIQLQSAHALLQETANALEMKGKETRTKQTALTEELWKRDNELLRKEMQRLKLVEELNDVKASLQHAQARLKSRVAEDMGQVNSRLEEKDKEIAALKRMLQKGEDRKLSEREIAEKLEDTVRRVKALADMQEEGSDTKATGILKNTQNALVQSQHYVLSGATLAAFEHLHSLCGDTPTSVAEVLSKAEALLGRTQ